MTADHEAALELHWKYNRAKVVDQVSGLEGVALNGMEVARLCHDAGVQWAEPIRLAQVVATFCSESLFYTRAFHHNIAADGTLLSTDWGPCQLNDKAHPDFFPGGDPNAVACDPTRCFKAAYQVFAASGGSLNPWYGWKNAVALDSYYVRRAGLAMMNFVARPLVELAKMRDPVIAGRTTPPTTTRVPMMSTHDLAKIYPPGT